MRNTYYKIVANPNGIALIDVCEYGDAPGMLIPRVNVPPGHRRKGIATKLFEELLNDADSEKVTLHLWINSYGEMTYDQLYDWYVKLGFVEQSNGVLRRDPR